MSYKVQSSEKLKPSGTENETKALLYLMGYREDSNEIYYFVIDFFNDVTGMSKQSDKLWDVQSKGDKKPSPKKIGEELVTLFKNYMSSFEFAQYIIFLGGVSPTLRVNNEIFEFGIENIKKESLNKLKEGLKEECIKKTYINEKDISEENINEFLKVVHFVITNRDKSEYVKKIIKLSENMVPDKEVLNAIFNEIKKEQDSKKAIGVVEEEVIEYPDESLRYGRYLTTMEIRLLALNRILNQDVISSKVPQPFIELYMAYPEEKRKDILEDCQHNLSRALFNTNCQEEFWRLLEDIFVKINQNPLDDIEKIYRKLDKEILSKCCDFDTVSTKYFIAIVKDGIEI